MARTVGTDPPGNSADLSYLSDDARSLWRRCDRVVANAKAEIRRRRKALGATPRGGFALDDRLAAIILIQNAAEEVGNAPIAALMARTPDDHIAVDNRLTRALEELARYGITDAPRRAPSAGTFGDRIRRARGGGKTSPVQIAAVQTAFDNAIKAGLALAKITGGHLANRVAKLLPDGMTMSKHAVDRRLKPIKTAYELKLTEARENLLRTLINTIVMGKK